MLNIQIKEEGHSTIEVIGDGETIISELAIVIHNILTTMNKSDSVDKLFLFTNLLQKIAKLEEMKKDMKSYEK